MKSVVYLCIVLALASCVQNDEPVVENDDNLLEFLSDTKSLLNNDSAHAIKDLIELAETESDQRVELTKSNMEIFLKSASSYSSVMITVEDHTVVVFNDLENCKMSGSWASCMPFATGYIRKGKLIFQEDYINNIIGLPDNQLRVGYLFK